MTETLFFNRLVTKSLVLNKNNDERFFTGILTVQMKDKQGEILIVDELMKVLPIWMKRGAPISDTHSNRIIGKGINYQRVKVKDKNGGIYHAVEITGLIYKDYKLDDDIWQKMKSGQYKGLSFGGATKSDREPVEYSDGTIAYNLKDLEHYEVAVCRDPAVPLALFTNIHTLAKSSKPIQYKKKGEDLICIQCNNVGCYIEKRIEQIDTIDIHTQIKKGLINITKPFAGYKDFDACVAANRDAGDAHAYCGKIYWQTEGKDKASVTLDPESDELTSGNHQISPTGKGMVEDHADSKCKHCGYITSEGTESLKEHMALSHPDKLESMGMEEVEKEPQESKTQDDLESNADEAQLPEVGEDPQTHQETANDSGIIHPTKDPMYDNYPERVGDMMIETPVSGTQEGLQPPEQSPTMYSGGITPDDTPKDQSNTETALPSGNGGSGQANSNISSDKLPNTYGKLGVGRDTWRNDESGDQPETAKDVDEEIEERPKDTVKSELFTLNQLGYVESKTPRQCQTCEYFTFPSKCDKTSEPVDPVKGCCNYWDPQKKLPDDVLNITKGDKAKIKLEGEPAEKLLESAGILPTEKDAVRVSQHKQYADSQPDTAQVSASSDTAFDPNPEESPYHKGDVGMRAFKSFENLLIKMETPKAIQLWKEEVPKEDAIKWWNIMNPSQRQHALDPNNWYTWSDEIARKNYEELDESQKRLVFSTYVFRNDGKTVEGAEVEQLVPQGEGTPQTEGVGANTNKWFPEDNPDTRNINATPEPMQVGQNTERTHFGRDEKEEELRKNLNILELEFKLLKLRQKS